MKFPIQNLFSKCEQVRSFLRIWSHLLKKSLMENFIVLCSDSSMFENYLKFKLMGFFCYNTSLNVLRSKFPKSGKIGFPVESSIVDLFEFCSELNLCEGRLDTRLCLQLT